MRPNWAAGSDSSHWTTAISALAGRARCCNSVRIQVRAARSPFPSTDRVGGGGEPTLRPAAGGGRAHRRGRTAAARGERLRMARRRYGPAALFAAFGVGFRYGRIPRPAETDRLGRSHGAAGRTTVAGQRYDPHGNAKRLLSLQRRFEFRPPSALPEPDRGGAATRWPDTVAATTAQRLARRRLRGGHAVETRLGRLLFPPDVGDRPDDRTAMPPSRRRTVCGWNPTPRSAPCATASVRPDFRQWGDYARYDEQRLRVFRNENRAAIDFYCFLQYHLHSQLSDASRYARQRGVVLKGDIPIGVSPVERRRVAISAPLPSRRAGRSAARRLCRNGAETGASRPYGLGGDGARRLRLVAGAAAQNGGVFRHLPASTTSSVSSASGRYLPMRCNGLLGRFRPALPYTREELAAAGFLLPDARYTRPQATDATYCANSSAAAAAEGETALRRRRHAAPRSGDATGRMAAFR